MSRVTSPSARRPALVWGVAIASVAIVGYASPAVAAPSSDSARSEVVVHKYAAVGAEKNPDDLTQLGDFVYVAFQNGVGSMGEPSAMGVPSSTIQQYSLSGKPGTSWNVVGKIDGMTADPRLGRILATVNEDGNSHFVTIDPRHDVVASYAYSGLNHGGGTDAISIFDHQIVISGSAPTNSTGAAAYTVKLSGSTAVLTPLIADNATAVAVNGPEAGKPVALALTDPDSNRVVPSASPRFAGSFMLDGQGDKQLLFLSDRRQTAGKLSVLNVATPVDDPAFATESQRTLWLTDPAANDVVAVSGLFAPGQAVSTLTPDSGPSYLATLNLSTGSLAPVARLGVVQPKGLIFTGTARSRDEDGNREQ